MLNLLADDYQKMLNENLISRVALRRRNKIIFGNIYMSFKKVNSNLKKNRLEWE